MFLSKFVRDKHFFIGIVLLLQYVFFRFTFQEPNFIICIYYIYIYFYILQRYYRTNAQKARSISIKILVLR